ncbi:MAG: xanthine dehydrogenase family protein molybdopterin-binding subunit [Steroidobacteraceae bacterium]
MSRLPQAYYSPAALLSRAVSRRAALRGLGALVIGVQLPLRARAQATASPAGTGLFAPNAFVRVGADDTVTIVSKHIEFGQGPWTGLATIAAEEMDADWSKVRAEHAPSDAKLYANLAFGTLQGTGGSSAIANSYEQMRKAGASARAMLVTAAARQWQVPETEISVAAGVITHQKSGRSGRFGAFAAAASRLPVPKDPPLKDAAGFRLIGRDHSVRRLDSAEKSNGQAMFTLDQRLPGMLTVVLARPPRFGGVAAQVDDAAARAVHGVVDVKRVPTGVAVYAENTWAALQGRKALRITWDETRAEKRGTDELLAEYRLLSKQPGLSAGMHGDPKAVFARGGQMLEAEYIFPYLAHGPMEPLDGCLSWEGDTAVIRMGSQIQTGDHGTIAATLGIPMEKVQIHTLLAGGSFGRRGQANSHFAAELAEVSKAINRSRPVKLMWTREDDLQGGYYRPMVVHRMRAAIENGAIAAWSSTVVTQSFLKGSPFEAMIQNGLDPTSVEGASELPYELPNFSCELHSPAVGVPTLWWRSVGHSHTGYAVETFIDELLEKTGKDPVAGRLELMGKQPRAAGVLRAVAKAANWTGPGPVSGRARGCAVVESFGSYVAQIAEVSMGESGEPIVHKVWCAVDCGVAVNPDVIRAQMEGGVGYGLGHALFAAVPLRDGVPTVSNFNNYRSLRINEMPEVEVVIVPSTEKPSGVGEPGVPPVAPAVGNALARLGKGRVRQLPFVTPKTVEKSV